MRPFAELVVVVVGEGFPSQSLGFAIVPYLAREGVFAVPYGAVPSVESRLAAPEGGLRTLTG